MYKKPNPTTSHAAINGIISSGSFQPTPLVKFDIDVFNKTLRLCAAFEADMRTIRERAERNYRGSSSVQYDKRYM